MNMLYSCFQWFKDTKMKANHNKCKSCALLIVGCFQWFKDTKMKANHNEMTRKNADVLVVSSGSKILK